MVRKPEKLRQQRHTSWLAAAIAALVAGGALLAGAGPTSARAVPTGTGGFPATDHAVSQAVPPVATDERVRVTPAMQVHASLTWIEVRAHDGQVEGYCSGTVVGSRAVLTAAHCLYGGEDEFATSVRVVPGMDGSKMPFGSQVSSQWMIPPEFINPASAEEQLRNDYALVLLPDRSLTDKTGAIPGGLVALPDRAFRDGSSRFGTLGYPGDCNDRACGDAASGSLYGLGDHAWLAPASFVWASPDAIMHDGDVHPGMSGGPLLRMGDLALAGITTSLVAPLARSTRVTQPMVNRMNTWCQQNGCSLSTPQAPDAIVLQYRGIALVAAADSAIGACPAERTFVGALAENAVEFQRSLVALADVLQTFDPSSAGWQDEFDRTLGELASARQQLLALQPPNDRFVAFKNEMGAGLEDHAAATRLLQEAIDRNSSDLLATSVDLLWQTAEHLDAATRLFPGLDAQCRPPLASLGQAAPRGGKPRLTTD